MGHQHQRFRKLLEKTHEKNGPDLQMGIIHFLQKTVKFLGFASTRSPKNPKDSLSIPQVVHVPSG